MKKRYNLIVRQLHGTVFNRFAFFPFIAFLFCAACSSSKPLITKNLIFRCDSNFNDGFILPVDIVYIPDGEKEDAIIGVSPDNWFESQEREEWPYLQTVSFSENNVRSTIKVELKPPPRTTKMIVIADYRGLTDLKTQAIVFTKDAKENEDIFITINGLLH